jgi:diphthamide synthase (EF-2-diphthine--ammonia ligase)
MIVCVNEKYLGKDFLGRKIDSSFLNDLPDNVDPCGENGEFHTFVYNAPYFNAPIPVVKKEVVYRKYPSHDGVSWDTGFYFLDIDVAD